MIQTTTPSVEGRTIQEYLGVVTGEAILGANIFKDLFAGIRDDAFPRFVSDVVGTASFGETPMWFVLAVAALLSAVSAARFAASSA